MSSDSHYLAVVFQSMFGSRRRVVYTCPAGGSPKTAVLHSRLTVKAPSRVFDPEDPELVRKLVAYQPASIAGSYDLLLSLDARLVRPAHSVVVFVLQNELTEAERDELWLRFEVPVFEQVRAEDGRLLATECEAHNGLHDLNAVGEPSLCACGRVRTDTRCVQPLTNAHAASMT